MKFNCIQDYTQLANFIAELNIQKHHHIGYCGENVKEIKQTLETDFSCEAFILVMNEQEIVGAIGLDIDETDNSAEVWGPFIKINEGAEQVLEVMWQELLKKHDDIKNFSFFINEENVIGQNFMQVLGANCTGNHQVLLLKKENFQVANLMNSTLFNNRYFEAFVQLHNNVFPNTYYKADAIVNRLNAENELIVLANDDYTIKGYVYIEVDYEHHEASIEYIAIAPQFQGQGLGTELLKIAMNRIFTEHQIEEVQLCVDSKNSRAINLYIATGFEVKYKLNSFLVGG